MPKKYKTLKELFTDVAVIRDKLAQCGANSEAAELTEVLECFWTTSSEAIVELLTSLDAIGASCDTNFNSEEMLFFNDMKSAAKILLDFQ